MSGGGSATDTRGSELCTARSEGRSGRGPSTALVRSLDEGSRRRERFKRRDVWCEVGPPRGWNEELRESSRRELLRHRVGVRGKADRGVLQARIVTDEQYRAHRIVDTAQPSKEMSGACTVELVLDEDLGVGGKRKQVERLTGARGRGAEDELRDKSVLLDVHTYSGCGASPPGGQRPIMITKAGVAPALLRVTKERQVLGCHRVRALPGVSPRENRASGG